MDKMSLQDLKDLFQPAPFHYVSPDGLYDMTDRTNWGSKRRARHNHRPTYKPPVASVSPAEWKRARRKKAA